MHIYLIECVILLFLNTEFLELENGNKFLNKVYNKLFCIQLFFNF